MISERIVDMETNDFHVLLNKKAAECEAVLQKFLPRQEGFAERVIEAMNYSVLAGGKRLRPMLILETAAMYGAEPSMYEPFMAALEMIHTYSLVHDDLPAMDNDTLRRGRKTTWNVYGDGMAVIAGDGLLNLAYETTARAIENAGSELQMRRGIRALNVLARNAGIYGMVGGQCADIEAETRETLETASDEEKEALLVYIHENKTAAMIRSGFQIGAILGGAPEEDIEELGIIADRIGLAFQIQDDILDVTGSSEDLGKTIGKDAEEGKVTYVSLHGLEAAAEKVESLTREALEAMDRLHVQNDFLRELALYLVVRSN